MNDNLLQLDAPVEVPVPMLQDDLRILPQPTIDNGGPVNKFLLCTLVCEMAREIKARAAHNDRHLPLLKIVREVLRSQLEGSPQENRLSAAGHLLNEEELRSAIEQRLREYLREGQELSVEAKRLDFESIRSAEAAKRNRGVFRHG